VATDLIEIDAERPSEPAIERAAAAVRRGDVVAIPTDALYTLVADPVNLHAVGRVFAAKGRDIHRALPLLVSDVIMAEELAKEMSARFRLLARYFWPGALTIIASASSLLERLAQPLISTSANLSGQPTCTSGIECFGMMDGRVDLILDGGTITGTGATTIDVTEPYWRVIKEGAIAEKEIAEVLKGT
jgi:L-threonylcarbamoyladenylate synthase